MNSLRDLEDDPTRTDYFGNLMTDAVEPSSSPSEGNSPYRTFIEDQSRGSGASSPVPGRTAYHTDDDHTSRKQARAYARETRESRKMSTLLLLTSERLDKEIRRANDAERKTSDTVALLRSTVEAKVLAQQEATRVGEELRLYKLQYENAQREIFKAQDLINQIEAQRQEAEAAAARARSTARKLKEHNLVMFAREEGRQLGYQEGLARGRRMGYDEARWDPGLDTPMQDDYVVQSEDDSISDDQDYVLAEQPSNIRLRSPFSVPVREQEPSEPPISRPNSRAARTYADVTLHAPAPTPIVAPRPSHATAPPRSHTPILAPSISRNRNRSNSQPYSIRSAPGSHRPNIPPDNWIPLADENNYIPMPPPHNMTQSPSASPSYPNQPLPKTGPPPAPPPPVIMNAITGPSAASIRIRDYAYGSGSRRKSAQTRENPQNPPPVMSPSSQTSTRISDYGLLTSPLEGERPLPIENGPTVPVFRDVLNEPSTLGPERTGWKYDPRSWTRKKSNVLVSSPRVSGGPRPRPESITQSPSPVPPPPVVDQRPRANTQSSTSSTSSISTSSMSSSSLDRVKQDPRKDAEGGSRTPLGWFFKKRIKDKLTGGNGGGSGGSSAIVPDITVESPSNSSQTQSGTPTTVAQPDLLSPEYREILLSPSEQPASRSKSQQQQNTQSSTLPPLAELSDLISPGAGTAADLPLGVVPIPQQKLEQRRSRSTEPPHSRSASRNRKEQEGYETAPLPPGISYPAPPPSPSVRSKADSRARSRPRSYTVNSGRGEFTTDKDPPPLSSIHAPHGIRV